MWVVRGPFDGDEGQDLTTESKLKTLVHRASYVSITQSISF